MKVTIYHKDGKALEVEPVDAKEILNAENSEYSAEQIVLIDEEVKKTNSKKLI
jgi:phosphatidylserine decarboxylase